MKEKINIILEDLIGLQLTRTTRAANMECFQFGTLKLINPQKLIGDFGLHIQCPWRLTNDIEIIIGSGDLYEQANETADYNENFNWDEFKANLRDVKLDSLIAGSNHIVKTAIADNFGGLQISFNNDLLLTVFPVISSKADIEYWRLLDMRNETKNHYLSTSVGYEL